ncbi:MAG: PDZ domain-containing protein [Anaerolineales bacterium]|nr:PDZ domain-containing protein [Anaerolineales bacterium]
MSRYRFLLVPSLVALGLLGAFLSGFFLDSYFDSQTNDFSILHQAYNILINHSYLDLPDAGVLEHGMIKGLVESSEDPYASFQEPVQHELESNNLQGSFGGIGVEFSYTHDGDILIYPVANGPASEAGIQNTDRLLKVDQLIVTSETHLDEIKAAIRGPVGESVKITIFRAEPESTLDFNIRREVIHLPSVTWRTAAEHPDIGIIIVHIIAESTVDEIKNAVLELEKSGASKFVLDLRDNGGGLLTAGVETARLFLKDGIILQQQYRGQDVETFRIRKPGSLSDLTLMVLINHNTASSAEIIAGSLQSHGRALLIGENSYGKDSIQLVFDLDDGSSIHVTAAKWWIPDLIPPIGEGGLLPDIPVTQTDDQMDMILNAAVEHFSE